MNTIRNIAVRLKKYLWLALIIPILCGLIGWFVPAGKAPSNYTATVTFALGNYDNKDLNEPDPVTVLLLNAPFYQEQLPDLWEKDQQNLLSQLDVTTLSGNRLQLTYKGTSREETTDTANQIAEAFVAYDRAQYQKKIDIIDQSIQTLDHTESDKATVVDRERFLYKLKTEKLNMRPAQLLEPAEAGTSVGNAAFSPKKRAVLGVMLGVTIVFFAAAFPEFVGRKQD